MIAVIGTQISNAVLPINADKISVATWLRLKNFVASMLFDSNNKGNELPK